MSSGGLSVSKSIGSETVQTTGREPVHAVPEPLNLEAPQATADELGLTDEPDFAPTANVDFLTNIGFATASELFSTEISLPSARIFNPAGVGHLARRSNGIDRH